MLVYIRHKRTVIFALLAMLLLSIFIALLPLRTLAANEFSYNVAVNYLVSSDGNTRVEEVYTVTNRTGNKYLDNIRISNPTDETKNLRVEYSDGADIPTKLEKKSSSVDGLEYDYDEITVNFTRENAGNGVSWRFIVSYDTTKLVETKGGAHTVYIPAISQEGDESYTVELSVPQNFGQLHYVGSQPTLVSTSNGINKYRFEKSQLTKKSLSLLFGDSTVYKINYAFPLQNTTNFPASFWVALPPNTSGQKVVIQSLTPQPSSTKLDVDGNILAEYIVPAKTNITVNTDVEAVIRYLEYDLSASGSNKDLPADLVQKYTKPTRYWPASNPALTKKAKELTQGKVSVAEQVRAINEYVISVLNYNNEKIKYNIRQGGLKAFENPNNAVCLEYSDLSISLLRAAGIPARMPIGYGYSGNLKQSNSVVDSLHSWVQVYVPNVGWMNMDPTWGEKFENFGYSDLDHFAFAIWGENDELPAAVTANGKDVNYQYENAQIEFKALPEDIKIDGSLLAKQYSILPFFAIASYEVKAPTTTAGDDYFLRVRHGAGVAEHSLGSFAPGQKTTKLVPVFGLAALNASTIDFTQRGESSLILSTIKIRATTWPMWVILSVLTGIVAIRMLRLRAKKRKLAEARAKLSASNIATTNLSKPKDPYK